MKKWITRKYEKGLESFVFTHFRALRSNSEETKEGYFDVLETRNWINIIALDEQDRFVLVKQYRHGIDDLTLEGPAGVVEEGEDPLDTAKRELLEETGYSSDKWTTLGRVSANPAFMNNYCSIFLAENCKKTSGQNLDPFEEIDVVLKSKAELKKLIESQEVDHCLFISAIGLYQIKGFSF